MRDALCDFNTFKYFCAQSCAIVIVKFKLIILIINRKNFQKKGESVQKRVRCAACAMRCTNFQKFRVANLPYSMVYFIIIKFFHQNCNFEMLNYNQIYWKKEGLPWIELNFENEI